ncbi:MAG: hypothetical protein LBQ23_02375 [Puniceicoccales bacterium]|jgi:hypothetical protein|nr:hypothetical protein [Puniceicoccales bacterium]
MKKEYKDELDKMDNFFKNYSNIPDEVFHTRCMDDFVQKMKNLVATKDIEVLEHLLDFFVEDFDLEVGGVCESLKSQIGVNYTLDQILEAFYKKFDSLARNHLDICAEMSMWFLYNDYFDKFKEMFNFIKSDHSDQFIENMKEGFKYDIPEDVQKMILLLEQDMKNW